MPLGSSMVMLAVVSGLLTLSFLIELYLISLLEAMLGSLNGPFRAGYVISSFCERDSSIL